MQYKVILLLFGLIFTELLMANTQKSVFGYAEKATLVQQDLTLPAKLDTGAKSASLNASGFEQTEKNGTSFLKFIVPSRKGDVPFECEYVGEVKIKVRSGEKKASQLIKKTIQRPVVLMKVRLNGKVRIIRVNLTNRKNFIYPMLIGREAIIAFDGIIDPSLKFSLEKS